MLHRLGWALSGALALIAVLALAHALEAGPLDPPGPVGSTMRTLDDLEPSWDLSFSTAGPDPCHSRRFECVLPDAGQPTGAAVLDHETGLVWERKPGTDAQNSTNSELACAQTTVGGRAGWRLPTIDELTTLFNRADPAPFDPAATARVFWSATVYGDQGLASIVVNAENNTVLEQSPGIAWRRWCVRGGEGGGRR